MNERKAYIYFTDENHDLNLVKKILLINPDPFVEMRKRSWGLLWPRLSFYLYRSKLFLIQKKICPEEVVFSKPSENYNIIKKSSLAACFNERTSPKIFIYILLRELRSSFLNASIFEVQNKANICVSSFLFWKLYIGIVCPFFDFN